MEMYTVLTRRRRFQLDKVAYYLSQPRFQDILGTLPWSTGLQDAALVQSAVETFSAGVWDWCQPTIVGNLGSY